MGIHGRGLEAAPGWTRCAHQIAQRLGPAAFGEIDVPREPQIIVSGNLWAHEFEFQRGSKRIGFVSKKVFSWADSYGIELLGLDAGR